jgi:16S rRNA (uracil1498-N3)-methyltransferase
VPVVDGPIAMRELVAMPGLVVADRDGAAVSELTISGDAWTVAVGPEGGFDDAERALLAGAPRLAVGPYILRAETAAIATAAVATSRRVWSSLHTEREEW